jgi:glycosyltransferase involved in cell wall biosynthesis
MTAAPAVSVVMPTHDKASYLERTLASWLHQRCQDYELIAVADGCTDSTGDVLARFRDRLPLRTVQIAQSGRAAARNRGVEVARGSLIVFSDDDRLVHPEFLEAHLRAQRETAGVVIGWQRGVLVDGVHLPALGLERVSCLVDALGPAARTAGAAMLSAAQIEEDWAAIEPFEIRDPWFEDYVLPVVREYGTDISDCRLAWSYGTTGNLSVSRSAIDNIGSFDEAFCGWGLEDTELHYRLVHAGLRTRVAEDARNYHQNHARDDTALKWNWLRNARHFLDKHEEMDVALYIQAEITNLPLADACRILDETQARGDSVLVRAYRRLLINHAYQLTTYGRMS